VTYYDQNGTGPHARKRWETLFMAKSSPSKPRAPAKSEPSKAAAVSADASRLKGWPAGEAPRPLLAAKAPPAKSTRRRGEPAAAKAATAGPEALTRNRAAKDIGSAPAPRRAERRQRSEIQTAPAPPEPFASAVAATAKPMASAAPAPSAPASEAGPPAAAPAPPAAGAPVRPPGEGAPHPPPDVDALAHNIAEAIAQGGKVLAAYLRPRESGEIKTTIADDIGEMVRSIGRVAEYYMADPQRAFAAQAALTTQFVDLWAATLQRLKGEKAEPIAAPDASDKRFADAAWRDNPYFDFIKQAYVLTTRWADDLVKHADELEPHDRDKAQFYLRQVTAALSPSNFVATNPELMRTTLAESGENLVRGLKMLAEDIQAGHGNLRIRQADARAFKLGVNLAATPGKVIFRNDLIELIQYEPTTPEVYKRPLLIVPPWINKFYILDLNPEKSFIRWAAAQGLTVFVISWVNPDERCADKDFDSYMREGILTALDCVEQATGEREVAAIGYCVGGTLLAATLAYMAAVGDKRISSATFFAAQIDFTDPGDLKVFVDAEQLKAVEERMAEQGYLDGSQMANAFNMLRPNDLIWSYYVNNYLKGKEPMPFDLLVWNSDSTRMPAANHRFYLRHCYLQNDLSNGRMVLGGKTLDLAKVTIPVYELATREDHIAPARSVFTGAKCFGGPVRYVMAGSGHIAGVVNPPGKPKYQYWSGGPPKGDFESWVAAAKETPGSWWPDWLAWLTAQATEKVPARKPGGGKLKPLGEAPGDYVRVKS
jgi:polyhydroxyalkanoate synthase subunit PhaC